MANNIADLLPTNVVTVLPSAARTTSPPDTYEFFVGKARGITVVIDVTAVTSTPATTITLLGVDRVSGKTWTLLASTALAATGTVVLRVAPGLPASANASANDLVPPIVRVSISHGNSNSMTYSVAIMASA